MIKEPFLSRYPSHFHLNPTVKAFITAEMFLWSGWNFLFPLLGIFVVSEVSGGTLQVVAMAYSLHLIARVSTELVSGRYISKSGDKLKLATAIVGAVILGLGYLALLSVRHVPLLYLVYIVLGIGFGISSPAKFSLFSMHLDKSREATEWSFYDASSLMGMAISGVVGGVIASRFGFDVLFIVASFVNLFGIFPYFFLLGKYSRE